MVFKHTCFYLLALLTFILCCNNSPIENKGDSANALVCDSIDSINIKDLMGFKFVGNVIRLYPDPCLPDSLAISEATKTGVFSIYKTGEDSLFVLLGNDMFSYELKKNNVIPLLNDSTLKNYYSAHYKIETDPDPPYWTFLKGEHDSILISLKKAYESYMPEWIYGSISDSTFKLNSFIQIGLTKQELFNQLGVDFKFAKTDFTIVLLSHHNVQNTWYDSLINRYDSDSGSHYLKYVLNFRSHKLIQINIL